MKLREAGTKSNEKMTNNKVRRKEGVDATSSVQQENAQNHQTTIITSGTSTQNIPAKVGVQHHPSPGRLPAHYFPPMPHLAYTMAAPPPPPPHHHHHHHGGPYYPPSLRQPSGWYASQPPPYIPPPGNTRGGTYPPPPPQYDPSSEAPPPPHGYYPPHYPPYAHHYPMQHMSSPDKSSPSKSIATETASSTVKPPAIMDRATASVASSVSPSKSSTAVSACPPQPQSRDQTMMNVEESQNEAYVLDVDPMRQDFYFYLRDHKDAIMEEARKRVSSVLDSPDQLLLLTYVNERIKSSWELEPKEVRDKYRVIEEADRARFMQEDEIASRHCATLTARAEKKLSGGVSPGKSSASPASKTGDDDYSVSDSEDHIENGNGDSTTKIQTKRESISEEEANSPVKKMRDMTDSENVNQNF
jgi:hypothetical protein